MKTVNNVKLDHKTYSRNRLAMNEIAINNRLFYRPRVVKAKKLCVSLSRVRVMITLYICLSTRYDTVIHRQSLNCVALITNFVRHPFQTVLR